MNGRVGLLALLAVAASAPARTAWGNPLDAFGLGARAPAMGSAYAAVADDSAAGYYNPAGLARGTDLRIDLGYQAAMPRLVASGVPQPLLDTRGLAAGMVVPGQLLRVRFAFGVTLFLPDQHITRIHVLSYDKPRLALYDNRTQRFYLAANLAVRLWRGLYLGGGLTFLSRSQGTVSLRGTVGLSHPESSDLQSAIDVDLVAVRYPQVGILWQASPTLTLALVYRHRFMLEIQQDIAITADVADPGQPPAVKNASLYENVTSVDLFQPWQLVAGAAVRLQRLLLTFDLTFARWSEMPPPAAQFDLKLDIGQFNDLVRLPKPMPYPDAGFHDLLIPALGMEWRAVAGALGDRLALDVRAGYRYEASPVPAQAWESSFGDADKHTFSAGLGVELQRLLAALRRPLALDAFVALTYLPERSFWKIDPRSPVGDFTVGGLVWQAGGQLRWRL